MYVHGERGIRGLQGVIVAGGSGVGLAAEAVEVDTGPSVLGGGSGGGTVESPALGGGGGVPDWSVRRIRG